MILDVLSRYSSLIEDYKVIRYRTFEFAYELVAEVLFVDSSTLFIRDYLFSNGNRKYAFHWQSSNGKCIDRWDNVPHHQDIDSFPFHKHVGKSESVENSEVMNLEKILYFMSNRMSIR